LRFFRIKRTPQYRTVSQACERGKEIKSPTLARFTPSNILYLPLPSLWKKGREKKALFEKKYVLKSWMRLENVLCQTSAIQGFKVKSTFESEEPFLLDFC
jgi:hypothetical protein